MLAPSASLADNPSMAGGAVAGIMMANNIAAAQRGIAAARDDWKALESLGLSLTLEPVTGLATATGTERPLLRGEIAGAKVVVRITTDLVHFAQTVIEAARATPFDGAIRVHPSPGGVLGYLRAWIGQDIQVGDETFDRQVLITGKPESAAAALLVPGVRERILALLPLLAVYSCEAATSKVVINGVLTNIENLEHAVRLAVAGATWSS